MPTKRRRSASGDLASLRRTVWATLCYLDAVVQNEELDHDTRLRSAHGVVVSAGVFRGILQDCRQETEQKFLSELAQRDAQERLARRNGFDDHDAIDTEIEDDGLPDEWDRTVEQAVMRGTMTEVEQSLALHVLPPPNLMLVLSQSLATIGQVRPPPVPPVVEPAPDVPAPVVTVHHEAMRQELDRDDANLRAMEAEVRGLIDAAKRQVHQAP